METDERNWNAFNSSKYEPRCDTEELEFSAEPDRNSKHGARWISLPNIAKPFLFAYCLFRLFFLFSSVWYPGVITAEVDNSLLTQLHHSLASLERVNKGSTKDLAALLPETWPHATYKQTLPGFCRFNDDTAVVCYPGYNAFESFMGDIALQMAYYNKMEDPSAFRVEFLDTLGKVRFEDEEGNALKMTFSDAFNRSDLLERYFFYILKASLLIELLNLSFCLLHGSYKNLDWSWLFSFMNGSAMVGGIALLHFDWRHLAPFLVSWKTRPQSICFMANALILFGSTITLIVSDL